MAASNGHTGCLRVLKEAGCNLEIPDLKGKTPAYYAAFAGNQDCLRIIYDGEQTDNNHKSKCCWPWFNTK